MHDTYLDSLSTFLVQKKKTISVAESVTAGLLQNRLSLAPNASCFFQGGVTAYNLEQKVAILDVDIIEAKKCNCVSQIVASQMALHVSQLFKSDYGLAITGYASPIPEKNIYQLHAYYAAAFKNNIFMNGMLLTQCNNAYDAQEDYVKQLLEDFTKKLR
jgi:nicotinamide-nucleotide amidase